MQSGSVLWFLRVLLQSYVTGRFNVQTQASRGSFGQGVAVQGGCTHSEPVLDPLMEGKPTEITDNKYRHSHDAAL